MNAYPGGKSVVCEHTASLASALPSSGTEYALKRNSTGSSPTLNAFYSSNWGADPTPDTKVTAMKQRARPTSQPTQTRYSNTKQIPYQGDTEQYTTRKVVAGIHTKTSLVAKTVYTQSTQACSHIKPHIRQRNLIK